MCACDSSNFRKKISDKIQLLADSFQLHTTTTADNGSVLTLLKYPAALTSLSKCSAAFTDSIAASDQPLFFVNNIRRFISFSQILLIKSDSKQAKNMFFEQALIENKIYLFY